jgi:hypothetical protein
MYGLSNHVGNIPELAGRAPQLSGFTGSPDTLRAMVEQAQGLRGEKSMRVRYLVDEIVRNVHPKDYAGEIVAIRNWAATYLRYTNDPLHVELIKDPERLVEEFYQSGLVIADCDEISEWIATAVLQVGRHAQYAAVGFAEPGTYTHVFTRAMEPRTNKWIICDPVAGTNEREMATRVTTYQIWSLDELPEHGPVEEF